jgi:hypothetical protein
MLSERDVARFVAKIRLADGTSDGCWLWTGAKHKFGYGCFAVVRCRSKSAHRVAYLLRHGSIPDGCVLDHLCRTPACVNPAHLEAVSQRTNVQRAVGMGAYNAGKTHCPAGHRYSDDNTYRHGSRRACRLCRSSQSQAHVSSLSAAKRAARRQYQKEYARQARQRAKEAACSAS